MFLSIKYKKSEKNALFVMVIEDEDEMSFSVIDGMI